MTPRRRAGGLGFLLLTACGGSAGGTSPTPPVSPPTAPPGFLAGADVSALERIEQGGAVFRAGGRPGDALAILRAAGASVFRLRLFVNPNDSEVQVNDLAYTLRMAARVKPTGAKLLLDLHYSDTWADPGHQTVPAAWAGLSSDSLEATVEQYSAAVVSQLRQAGTLPDIVQVGNEVDAGMLWPTGRVGGVYDTPDQWDHFTRLLKAGIRGVRSALLPGDSVRIMLHYSQGADSAGTRWFLDHITRAAVPFDLLGLSYYPWWHGSLAELRANLQATAAHYGMDIMVVETAYPWRSGGWEEPGQNTSVMTWPITTQGQAAYLHAVLTAVAVLPHNHGAGVLWWYPEAVPVPGLFVVANGSLALFDNSGNMLPAAGQFADFKP